MLVFFGKFCTTVDLIHFWPMFSFCSPKNTHGILANIWFKNQIYVTCGLSSFKNISRNNWIADLAKFMSKKKVEDQSNSSDLAYLYCYLIRWGIFVRVFQQVMKLWRKISTISRAINAIMILYWKDYQIDNG